MKKVKDNFDLYWVDIEYSDNDKSKNRPCVLINISDEGYDFLKLTSNIDLSYPHYVLKDYLGAGLKKPSAIQIDRIYRLETQSSIGDYIGTLTTEDIRGLINAPVSSNRLKLVLQEDFK